MLPVQKKKAFRLNSREGFLLCDFVFEFQIRLKSVGTFIALCLRIYSPSIIKQFHNFFNFKFVFLGQREQNNFPFCNYWL